MHTDVPTVLPTAELEEIVQALEQSQRRRAVVIDDARCVVGIITDGDLLRRSQQGQHPGLISRLRSLVTGQNEVTTALPDAGETAATLMTAHGTRSWPKQTRDERDSCLVSHFTLLG
jgi:CBS domain-containing protein